MGRLRGDLEQQSLLNSVEVAIIKLISARMVKNNDLHSGNVQKEDAIEKLGVANDQLQDNLVASQRDLLLSRATVTSLEHELPHSHCSRLILRVAA